jgi:hypothetical protein
MINNKGDYAEVNGLDMFYEVHGAGETLILLHSGVGAIEMFGEVLRERSADGPALAAWRARNRPRTTSLADTLVDSRTTYEVWFPKKGVSSA